MLAHRACGQRAGGVERLLQRATDNARTLAGPQLNWLA